MNNELLFKLQEAFAVEVLADIAGAATPGSNQSSGDGGGGWLERYDSSDNCSRL